MTTEELVPLIHATPTKAVLYITGGGTEVLPMLLKRGGGSATILSARIPYANSETVELLGGTPDKFVSEETTRKLAMAAYQKALALRTGDEPVVGVACSSSLQKTPEEREGRIHYVYAALQTGYKTVSLSLTLDPGHFTWEWQGQPIKPTAYDIREWEERINAEMVLYLLAEGCGITDLTPVHKKIVRRSSQRTSCEFFPEFLAGGIKALLYVPGVGFTLPVSEADYPMYMLPGSFHPAHPGHEEMAQEAEKFGGTCDFELSIRNADKPLLDFISLEERLLTVGNRRVWVTNAPTFVEKAKLFPGTTFVVGWDTAIRIVNPKYAGSVDDVVSAFEATDTQFLVFGREVDGVFHAGLDDFPKQFAALCTAITEPLPFRAVSSSGIRRQSH